MRGRRTARAASVNRRRVQAVSGTLQSCGCAVLYQLISLLGAAIVLVGFAGLQTGRLDREGFWFNVLNLVGSIFLFWVAVHDRRAGFIALEAIWAVFSLIPLAVRRRVA